MSHADLLKDHAVSLISLTLVRNRYVSQKGINFGRGYTADLVARKAGRAFAVNVFSVHNEREIRSLYLNREAHADGMPVYVAIVIASGSRVLADEALKAEMRYSEETLRVEALPDEAPVDALQEQDPAAYQALQQHGITSPFGATDEGIAKALMGSRELDWASAHEAEQLEQP